MSEVTERSGIDAERRAGAVRGVFGTLRDGTVVEKAVLRNAAGMTAEVIGWGAALRVLSVPDRDGWFDDVVLGYDTLEEYVSQPEFFGATVGRFANRIAGGRFELDGRSCSVPATDGPNALHGGEHGFDKRCWTLASLSGPGEMPAARFRRTSPAGEEGFPGTLLVEAGYELGPDNTLVLDYRAETDAATVVNVCNHTYFNLGGDSSGMTALDHLVAIHADGFVPVDAGAIPTGEIRPVSGTAFDFRSAMRVCDRIRDGGDPQIRLGRGYDHTFVLRGGTTATPKPAARVVEPNSGRLLEISTTEPGVQFYSGNFLNGTRRGKGGWMYRQG
ncbi:MAG: galactose mutarotase, partial [Gluconacetobacter diazotrophicus]|nr:galactose mutarotase [Gluconacetobacter diazotrophicus]